MFSVETSSGDTRHTSQSFHQGQLLSIRLFYKAGWSARRSVQRRQRLPGLPHRPPYYCELLGQLSRSRKGELAGWILEILVSQKVYRDRLMTD